MTKTKPGLTPRTGCPRRVFGHMNRKRLAQAFRALRANVGHRKASGNMCFMAVIHDTEHWMQFARRWVGVYGDQAQWNKKHHKHFDLSFDTPHSGDASAVTWGHQVCDALDKAEVSYSWDGSVSGCIKIHNTRI